MAFGQFCTNSSCTTYEWGIKANVTIVGYDVGIYYGFDEGLDLILGNDGHVLIDQYGAAYQSQREGLVSAQSDRVQVSPAALAVNGVVTEPIAITADTENFLVALGWQTGTLQMDLYEPDGALAISNTAHSVFISETSHSGGSYGTIYNKLIGVRLNPAQPPLSSGAWHAVIRNVIGEAHWKFLYLVNKGAPGTTANRGQFIQPGAGIQDGSGVYTVTWVAPPGTPPSATISLNYTTYYSRTSSDPALTQYSVSDILIVKNWRFDAGSYPWDTSGLSAYCRKDDPSCPFCYSPDRRCYFQLRAVVDDGVNDFPSGADNNPDDTCQPGSELPSERAFDPNRFPGISTFTASGMVYISDTVPPAAPTNLQVTGVDSAILARWTPSSDKDVAAYLVQWGMVYGVPEIPMQWYWEGGAPTQAERVTASYSPTLRIGGLSNTLPFMRSYGVIVSQVDASGNVGPATPMARAWPVTDTAAQAPFAPLTPTLVATTSTGVTIAWQPAPSGPTPASYRVMYRQPITFATVLYTDTTATSAALDGLQTGATYEARVFAANSQGWRSASSPPLRFIATNGVDADGDGAPDDWEAAHSVSIPYLLPFLADTDRDDLSDLGEYHAGADPWNQDSDGDGFSDGEEYQAGTDPLDGARFPTELTLPRLSLDTNHVTFYAKQGQPSPSRQWVYYSNEGGGTLDMYATSTSAWISSTLGFQLLPNQTWHYVDVGVDTTGIQPGFYSGIVRLDAAYLADPIIGKPQCIRVNLWMLPADADTMPNKLYIPFVAR